MMEFVLYFMLAPALLIFVVVYHWNSKIDKIIFGSRLEAALFVRIAWWIIGPLLVWNFKEGEKK